MWFSISLFRPPKNSWTCFSSSGVSLGFRFLRFITPVWWVWNLFSTFSSCCFNHFWTSLMSLLNASNSMCWTWANMFCKVVICFLTLFLVGRPSCIFEAKSNQPGSDQPEFLKLPDWSSWAKCLPIFMYPWTWDVVCGISACIEITHNSALRINTISLKSRIARTALRMIVLPPQLELHLPFDLSGLSWGLQKFCTWVHRGQGLFNLVNGPGMISSVSVKPLCETVWSRAYVKASSPSSTGLPSRATCQVEPKLTHSFVEEILQLGT